MTEVFGCQNHRMKKSHVESVWLRAGGLAVLVAAASATGCSDASPPVPGRPQQNSRIVSPEQSPGPASTVTQDTALGPIQFRARSEETGIRFVHFSGISEHRHFPALNGSGLAVWDYDRDGRADVLFATACEIPVPQESATRLTQLYRGAGNWNFADASQSAGFSFDGFVAGVAASDFDNDGFADLFLSCYGSNRLYRNAGDGTFQPVHSEAFPPNDEFSAGAAWADADGDGNLDLYVCNYGLWSQLEDRWCGNSTTGVRAFCEPTAITAVADTIYQNRGDGSFDDVSARSPIGTIQRRSQGVIAAHFNDDAMVDFYVANDAQPNCLYLNDGQFHFREVAEAAGAALDLNGRPQASMGLAVSDFDHNTTLDVFVTNYTGEHNTLYRNIDRKMFLDQSSAYGVVRESVPLVGWGTTFTDFDQDGWEDLLVVNGHTDPVLADSQGIGYAQRSLVYHNRNGRFELLPNSVVDEALTMGSSRGLAVGDLDGDFDCDVIFGNQDAAPGILENMSAAARRDRVIRISLTGTVSSRDAIGSAVSPPAGSIDLSRCGVRTILGGGTYLSTSSLTLEFPVVGCPEGRLELRWPGGRVTPLEGLVAGNHYLVIEADDEQGGPRVLALPD